MSVAIISIKYYQMSANVITASLECLGFVCCPLLASFLMRRFVSLSAARGLSLVAGRCSLA